MHPEIQKLQEILGWELPMSPDSRLQNWFPSGSSVPSESAYLDHLVLERAQLDRESWWYGTRNRVIIRALSHEVLPSTIWDVGSGTGVVANALKASGWEVIGIEPSLAGSQMTAELGIPTFQGTLDSLHLPDDSIDAVSICDVLEHVDDRGRLLNEVFRTLRPNGTLLVTVPALPLLWSQFDVNERHRLRYTRTSLLSELVDHGFEVSRIGYFFLLTVMPLLLLRAIPFRFGFSRMLSDSRSISARGGILGSLATTLEEFLALRAPFGSSILAIARKPLVEDA